MEQSKVTYEDVAKCMKDYIVRTEVEFGKPCTYVTLRMPNGFTLGESTTCVDPANYSEEIGRDICLKRLEDKVWYLLGYALQEKLFGADNTTAYERLVAEKAALSDKMNKLGTALHSDGFLDKVGEEQYQLMCKQLIHMGEYSDILKLRIEKW